MKINFNYFFFGFLTFLSIITGTRWLMLMVLALLISFLFNKQSGKPKIFDTIAVGGILFIVIIVIFGAIIL